jgi:hypothetical protein
MPLFVTVTPGTTVTSSTTLDASTLNLLGTPSVDVTGTVDGGSITLGVQSVPLTSLYYQADQTIIGNGAGSSASPVALTTTDLVLTATTVNIKTAAVTTAKIADSNVTYAKIQNVADARLLGRSNGTAGVVQELTVGSGLTLSGGALTNGILRHTTTAKSIPLINATGANAQAVQWLTTASELPSLSVSPQMVRVVLECFTNDGPFVVGNELDIQSVVMQGYKNNFPLFSYNPVISSGIISGSNIFLNVWFSSQYPGNAQPYADAAVPSKLMVLTSTGAYQELTRSSWKVKAYLMYASTWA